jgi:hypothetical protein
VRAKAQEHPDSWIFLYISLFDQVLKATLFRSAGAAAPSHAGGDQLKMSRDTTSAPAVMQPVAFNARYAIRIVFNPKLKVPNRVWRLTSLKTVLIGYGILMMVLFITVALLLSSFLSPEAAGIAQGFFSLLLMAAGFTAVLKEWGPFDVSMKLHMNPFILLFADKHEVLFHSSWLPRTVMPNRAISFVASEGRFMSFLSILREREPPVIVFSYPTYFRPFLALDDDLPAVAMRLNRLVSIARSAPDLDVDSPIFEIESGGH